MKVKFLLVIALCVSFSKLIAQQDPLLSHYLVTPETLNPAFNSTFENAYISALHRTQWAGFSTSFDGSGGAPNTQFLNFSVPIKSLINTAGVNIINDNLGPRNTISVQFNATYQLDFVRSSIIIAVMPGLVTQTLNDELRFVDPDDPFNTGSRETQQRFDVGGALLYKNFNNYFVGITINHMLAPSFDFNVDRAQNILERNYYLLLGKEDIPLFFNFKLNPTFLLRTDLNTFSFDIGAVGTYSEKLWGGVSYRQDESITLLFGYNFLENQRLKIGYSFDYVTNQSDAKELTSHEIFIRYDLPNLIFGSRKPVKTPRYRF